MTVESNFKRGGGTVTWDKEFQPDTVAVGGVSTLVFTINAGSGGPLTSVDFTDNLPAAVSKYS